MTPDPVPTDAVHRPVLLEAVVEGMAPREGSVLVDGTAGAGGHTAALARRVGPTGRVVGLDRDPEMLALAERATRDLPVTLVKASYRELGRVLDAMGIGNVAGVVLDLGLSSDQLAWGHRGFSFARDGPLDMRFDPEADVSAADLVNDLPESDLADLIYRYGEERHSRRIARRIVEARRTGRIETTARLAEVVRRGVPGRWGAIDPATRTFQALRIAVNGELEGLDEALKAIPERIEPGGRFAVISFHSLEDRRVKVAFRDDPRLRPVTKKPVTASAEEVHQNPRARSAKLRVAERCQTTNGTTPSTPRKGRS